MKKSGLSKDVEEKLLEIGTRIANYRKNAGSNYKKFANQHDLNSMTLWRIEKGEDFKMSTFLQILKSLEISPKDFFK